MLGHRVARGAIAKYITVRLKPLPTWRAFIRTHLEATAVMDSSTVRTITGTVLYVFVLLHHAQRRIVHFNVASSPTTEWVVRQLQGRVSLRHRPALPHARQ